MRKLIIFGIVFSCLFHTGCEQQKVSTDKCVEGLAELNVYSGFSPTQIRILPLTQITDSFYNKKTGGIAAYVSLADSFGCQIKGPAVLRFELYEKIARSSGAKGKRVVSWPDFDLRNPSDNSCHWQDFLRSYKFELDCHVQKNKHYVLQVTAICPSGKRLSCESSLSAVD